ncbi:hypothetical protein OPQ81_003772 [Rhizoctonia solani]|nr:hypothetical protein OPQ81_003772 [Rhizoctonia solani]
MSAAIASTLQSTPCQVRVQSASSTLKTSELHLLQAELRDNLVPNMDFQLFTQEVLKLSKDTYQTLMRSYWQGVLGSPKDWDRFIDALSAAGGEPFIYDPLLELVHWIQDQLEQQLKWKSATNLRFRNTWSRALAGSVATRKPDITGVSDRSHASYPEWKDALVVWEVKHKSPVPLQTNDHGFAPRHLFSDPPLPRRFVSDQNNLPAVSKKRNAPESLPFATRKKSKSNSTSQGIDPVPGRSTLPDNAIRKPETPLEQLLSYCLEAMVAQPHRRHTIGLLLENFRLQLVFHCRSFVVTSKPFDIREDQGKLAIAIAALWLADLETLGFEKRFIGPDGQPALYPIGSSVSVDGMELIVRRAIYRARSLLGRVSATLVGADKQDPSALYVIKISCQAQTRAPESEFLKAAANVPNVIQLVRSANWGNMLDGFGEDFLRSVEQFETREFRVLVLSPVCELITTVDESSVFKKCFVKLVKAHRALYEQHVLHCDISIGNLMYDPRTQEPYLIDADLGKLVTQLGTPSSNHRTGTLPFMAIDLLAQSPPPHLYRHDLESFFYVLVWICAEDHAGWHRVDSVAAMAKEKSFFMNTFDIELLQVKKFAELKSTWITELHSMFGIGTASQALWIKRKLTSPFDNETLGGFVTYDNFLKAIAS